MKSVWTRARSAAVPAVRHAVLILLAALVPPPAGAQDSATVVPDPAFGRSGLRRLLLGDHYRDLWLTPLRIPVLDLAREHGGLTPTRRGGGLQTKSLRFQAGNGREYVFRNVRKDPSHVVPDELRGSLAEDAVHDQMSAMHPAGAVVVAPILDAAGVLHAAPRFFVMPDDPRLGEFRAEFAGQLGMLEERPTEAEDDHPGFAGAEKIVDTHELVEELWDEPWVKVDARAFLTARLIDLYLGDWDRHEDQWRWARVGERGAERWIPIPRDRDQAFVRYDGLLLGAARATSPQLLVFDEDYADPVAATWNGRNLDRRLLTELPRSVWDSTARFLQRVITDAVIDTAVGRLPPEYFRSNGEWLREMLIVRRDGLHAAAIRTYELLARNVRIQAGDRADHADVERAAGATTVRLSRSRGGAPYFERAFLTNETREIQLDLRDGDDRLLITGDGEGPLVRVIGGSGADTLMDSSRTRNSRFYDVGDATVASGRSVDRRRYVQPSDTNPAALPERDWGSKNLGFPTVYANSDVGLSVGYSWSRMGYGFRRQPYATRLQIAGEFAFGPTSGRIGVQSRWKAVNRDRYLTLGAVASGIESLHFYGFGNDTPDTASTSFYRVRSRAFGFAPGIGWGLEGPSRFEIQLRTRHTGTDLDDPDNQGPIAAGPYGTGEFGQAGVFARYEWDSRDFPGLPSRGMKLRLESAYYPLVWSDADNGFGTLDGMIGAFVSPGNQDWLTFAFRAGGRHTWGDVPFFEAAYLGGTPSLRGYPRNRFGGESSVYGSAEARLRLGRVFIIVPGELGLFGLTDGGKVFVDAETDSGDWHTNAGGGVFYAVLKRTTVISLGAAQGEEGARFYLGLGMGY